MSKIQITKKDVFWGYTSQFFSIASGIIVLPFLLKILSAEEIGMNYLMLTIASLVALFDFGFAPQFGRNVAYVFNGVQELKKEGIIESGKNEINYRLLATVILVAKRLYLLLAFVVLVFMLTVGTIYISSVTDGFSTIDNSLVIWLVYSISIFFNIYFTYYTSFLTGRGLIMQAKKAMLVSKIVYVLLILIFLYWGLGLLSIALSNLLSPFVSRFMSYRYFFTSELRSKIGKFDITKDEETRLFGVIWYNAKKLGLVFLGSYAINKFGMFIAGLYLSLSEIASYGLMIQLTGVLAVVSTTFFTIQEPFFVSLKIDNKKEKLLKEFSFSILIHFFLFIGGGISLVILVPHLLSFLDSATTLPGDFILILYLVIVLLEHNHSIFASFIVIGNKVPFVESSLIAGMLIAVGSYLSLSYTSLGVLGLVLVQGICQLGYANWKWPYEVLKEYRISIFLFVKLGIREGFYKTSTLLCYGKC